MKKTFFSDEFNLIKVFKCSSKCSTYSNEIR